MLRNILNTDTKKHIEIFETKLPNTTLKEIAKKNIPDFKNSIIALDGDSSAGNLKNIIILPGSKGPDELIYEILKKLPDNDNFWNKTEGYTKQFCFKDCMSIDSTSDKSKKRVKLKNWYISQKKYWGRSSSYVWKLWISKNEDTVKDFSAKFESML